MHVLEDKVFDVIELKWLATNQARWYATRISQIEATIGLFRLIDI